ncbi:tRNA lysidine(34) synthetase TilS C-terminal domain-containing protein [Prolixibacter bellariivorans]|nr:tRNA lysidine(34) synthetase TilS C-terminal domain-containing protein [Prolixibacter bellariivorans]
MSLPEKENTWLVTNGEQVVWIIGKRIDDRYKITDETTRVLELVMGGK